MPDRRIKIGDVELWTGRWNEHKAFISCRNERIKAYLAGVARRYPDQVELMVNDEDFCQEDMDGTFTVIVDPTLVNIIVTPGSMHMALQIRELED